MRHPPLEVAAEHAHDNHGAQENADEQILNVFFKEILSLEAQSHGDTTAELEKLEVELEKAEPEEQRNLDAL